MVSAVAASTFTRMRPKCGRAAAITFVTLTALAASGAASAAPEARAQAKAKASVVNHHANLRGDGTVPVKIHCAAAHGSRCTGTLRLVINFNGTKVPNTPQGFAVAGKKTKTFHLQATGDQLQIFLSAGVRDAIVKVKEKKPHRLPAHSSIVTVHVPR